MTTSATLTKLTPEVIEALDRRANYVPRHAAPDDAAAKAEVGNRRRDLGALIRFGRRP